MSGFDRLNSILSSILLAIVKENDNKCSIMVAASVNHSLVPTIIVNMMVDHDIPMIIIPDEEVAKDNMFGIDIGVTYGNQFRFL